LFLREHNRLAAAIERAHPSWDDERVFQTCRNTVIVLFIKIVVEEYINHISPTPFRFEVDPEIAWDAPWNKPNRLTTEFSLLYRWHSLVPDVIQWRDRTYPIHTTFLNNAPLIEGGLAQAFADMSSQRAGRLGAFNTTDALIQVETRAILQGRLCRLASYSDYRDYVKLGRPTSFRDISVNSRVTELLARLYKQPSEVEFYVGLFAEDTVANSPLPPLILRMVAVDAYSQALTNPLLSRSVFNVDTFSTIGWEAINLTHCLKDVLARNCNSEIQGLQIGMTQESWKYQW
jgi:prostaglandin-endoperoxide synthase 2